ncbi:L-histidine N(alpha)-methyltransferase [Rubricoccus marinus]|uniref:Dimethylhistidine N-methyltransferase n=1 Tax=Rubricoccus marinus TaxID=716817 RepID=A0A259TYA5_9BACT|nr:L-histidine N(alpha)-methyltransferase [Rubricoccus marinus]OZC02676.1 dimethylhistidine N-methyltransferase [Rubricoccus marinus]
MPDSALASGATTAADAFRRDVLSGLRKSQKTLPSKYLYDARGSELFDQITRLDVYYPTETERAILREHIGEIAAAIGDRPIVVEYGSGSSDKTRILLEELQHEIAAYVPIDISPSALGDAAERLRQRYPAMEVLPVAADYTRPLALPELPPHDHIVVFFPGSTIGNFEADEARAFFAQAARVAGSGRGTGGLLIGADQRKPLDVLIPAYDDPEGVTAAFNLNLLTRINRELDADFDLGLWRHEARWNENESRIEMHLVSQADQRATVAGEAFAFASGETIHTEISTKYGPEGLADLAADAGWTRQDRWTDARSWFAVERYTLG